MLLSIAVPYAEPHANAAPEHHQVALVHVPLDPSAPFTGTRSSDGTRHCLVEFADTSGKGRARRAAKSVVLARS